MTSIWPESTLIETRGATVRVVRAGSGPALVLLHGGRENVECWYPALPLANRYTLIAFDARAHGGTRVHAGDYSNEAIVEDLAAALDHFAVDRAVLVGYSMGAGLALKGAEALTGRTAGLVLLSYGGNSQRTAPEDVPRLRKIYNADQENLRANGLAALLPGRIRRMFTSSFESNLAAVERYREAVLRSDSVELSNRPLPDLEAETSTRLDIPVLVLAGEDDRVFPPERGREAAEGLPDSRFETLPGGHAFHIEYPDEFNRRIRAFLEEIGY